MLIDIQKIDDTASTLIGEGEGRSFPIPVGRSMSVVHFLVYPRHLNADHIGEPIGLIEFNRPSNEVRRVHAPSWRGFGIRSPENRFRVGERLLRQSVDRSVWIPRHKALCEALNLSIPVFENSQILTKQSRVACEFVANNYFDLAERGLDAYYKAIGREWFAWLERFRGHSS